MSRLRIAALAASALLVAGCTSSISPEGSTASPTTSAEATVEVSEQARRADFEMIDPWVKAAAPDAMMTGAFGTLVNNSSDDIHVIAVSSPVTERAELHEMVSQGGTPVMAEMPDGFVVEAGQSFVLEPGGNHFMLMGLTEAIEAGEEVEFSLELADGRTFSWIAPVRTYDGANESYQEADGSMTHSDTMDGEPTDGTTEENEPSSSPSP